MSTICRRACVARDEPSDNPSGRSLSTLNEVITHGIDMSPKICISPKGFAAFITWDRSMKRGVMLLLVRDAIRASGKIEATHGTSAAFLDGRFSASLACLGSRVGRAVITGRTSWEGHIGFSIDVMFSGRPTCVALARKWNRLMESPGMR